MGKEYTIDIRLWVAALGLVYYLGRMDVFGLVGNDAIISSSAQSMTTNGTTNMDPSSQHFVLDFKGASAEFLQSTDKLIQALTEASKALDMELISATCQNNKASIKGIACLGVLDKGQMAVQTWPQNNAMSVDVIQHGSDSILPSVSVLLNAFGANTDSKSEKDDDKLSFWSVDYRGKAIDKRHTEAYMEIANSNICKVKEVVLEEVFEGKKLEIWDVMDMDTLVNYEDSVAHNLQPGDPRWINNELGRTHREVFVDGKRASSTNPEQSFGEIFLHPAMLSHENPKKIAILGGIGDMIQESLKCNVDSVTWIQPNVDIINSLQKFIPAIYDCSDLEGRSDNCLEDSTLRWVKQDAKDYFEESADAEGFDVILDFIETPQEAEILASYVASIMNGLSPDGALMISLGHAPTILHPRGEVGFFGGYEKLFQTLEGLDDVESMTVFEEDSTLSNYSDEIVPNSFMFVCKSAKCRQRFFSGPDFIESQLPGRFVSRDNKPILDFYDGVVHATLQVPPKAYETVYCRRDPMPEECAYRTLDFSKPMFEFDADPEKSAFEVTEKGVVATMEIPGGSYIMAKDLSKSLRVSEAILGAEGNENLSSLGKVSSYSGERSRILEIGLSGLIRTADTTEESNVGCWFCPEESQRPKYSPVYDRHYASFDSFLIATKPISKGEELVRLG